jgi:hypothetical protein
VRKPYFASHSGPVREQAFAYWLSLRLDGWECVSTQAGSSCETGGLPIEDSDAASMRRGSAIPVGERFEATGGWIGFGEAAQTEYPIRRLADGEHVSLGEVDLEILSTPGHTWESISVLVRERIEGRRLPC